MEVVQEAELYQEPEEFTQSQGRLPVGTLLRLLGKRKGALVKVEVELVDRVAEGWVLRDSLNITEQESELEEWEKREGTSPERAKKPVVLKPSKKERISVPKDEGLLLLRRASFVYGLTIELPYNTITDANNNFFTGPGYRLAANLGFYFTNSLLFRMEASYGSYGGNADGSSPVGAGTPLEIGFVEFRVQPEYEISDFMLFGYLQYSYGAGAAAGPSGLFGTPADLSSPWAGLGAGYRFDVGGLHRIVLQLTYGTGLIRSPLGFSAFSARFLWEIQG